MWGARESLLVSWCQLTVRGGAIVQVYIIGCLPGMLLRTAKVFLSMPVPTEKLAAKQRLAIACRKIHGPGIADTGLNSIPLQTRLFGLAGMWRSFAKLVKTDAIWRRSE